METKIILAEPDYNLVMQKIAKLEALLNLELNKSEAVKLPPHEQN